MSDQFLAMEVNAKVAQYGMLSIVKLREAAVWRWGI